MSKKITVYSELAYVLGLITLALGTALMEKADMGMSMVVAPAYLVHLILEKTFPWFTFGVAEYTFQAVLLILMILILKRFKVSYLFSFVTAVIYGIILDLVMSITAPLPSDTLVVRLLLFTGGMIICSIGIAFLFRTYIAPEVYELFVKELTEKYHLKVSTCKTAYDCISCAVSVAMSFAFFGFGVFEGVKAGTIVCALINGWMIGQLSEIMEKCLNFVDLFRKDQN